MDGIVGGVPASGPSGWQGGEVFSEVQRWNRIEADGQMKTPFGVPFEVKLGLAHRAWMWYDSRVMFKGALYLKLAMCSETSRLSAVRGRVVRVFTSNTPPMTFQTSKRNRKK